MASSAIIDTEGTLKPVRQAAAAAALPQEIQVLDMETGRLHERQKQLERTRAVLEHRETLADEIAELQAAEANLQAEVDRESATVDYARAGDRLTDGMITYLNAIKNLRPGIWPHAAVSGRVTEHDVLLSVGQHDWHTHLGATHCVYFLLAYQHALLSLTGEADCHYPGLTILDFPLTLDDGTRTLDIDSFAMEPFVALVSKQSNTQLIAAGNAFEGLEGATYTRLTKQWT